MPRQDAPRSRFPQRHLTGAGTPTPRWWSLPSPLALTLCASLLAVFPPGQAQEVDLSTLDEDNNGEGIVVENLETFDALTFVVDGIGDFNGDGRGDFVIGTKAMASDGSGFETTIRVVFGAPAFETPLELEDLERGEIFTILGDITPTASPFFVDGVGDFNGDGFDDLFIGPSAASSNTSYLIFGEANPPEDLELADLDRDEGALINLDLTSSDGAGAAFAAAGDVNGDGFADLLIGDPLASPEGRASAGQSYVIFGEANPDDEIDIDLDDLLRRNEGFVIFGASPSDGSGSFIGTAGDVNGDGFADLLIGDPQASPENRTNAGQSFVVFGAANPSDEIDLDDLRRGEGFVVFGAKADDRSGTALSAAGDVNGDGLGDFIIGVPLASPDNRTMAGRIYAVYGSADPLLEEIDLDDLEDSDTEGFVVDGAEANDMAGLTVSGLGDINGDGLHDLLIGAASALRDDDGSSGQVPTPPEPAVPGVPGGGPITGIALAYVVFGAQAPDSPLDLGDIDGFNGFVAVDADNETSPTSRVTDIGDVDRDGLPDFAIGAYPATVADPEGGTIYLVYGPGASLNPPVGTIDTDGDGRPNLLEVAEGTDPTVKDNDIFTDVTLFVQQLYRDFLIREGDAAGVAFWVGEISAERLTRFDMYVAFLFSDEFQAQVATRFPDLSDEDEIFITALYLGMLQRDPDAEGLAFWLAEFEAGRPIQDLVAAFYVSDEYRRRFLANP